MSRYELPQLVKMWAQEMLSSEQAIGQVLLHLQALDERVREVEQRVRRMADQEQRPGMEKGSIE